MAKKTATILNGKAIADQYLHEIRRDLAAIRKSGHHGLTLATLRVGHYKESLIYEKYLGTLFRRLGVGIRHTPHSCPENSSEKKVVAAVRALSRDPHVTGIMVFSPLPDRIKHANVFENLDRLKDVEGRTFLKSHFGVFSPTANAAMALIDRTGMALAGKEAVVIGHSDIVGKPMATLLMDRHATVTVCHKQTRDLRAHVARADLVVTAVGKPNLIPGNWIKKGATVIDVGESVVRGKVVGDVEFGRAKKRAAYLSPVPGGVGPLTNVMLIKNLILLYQLQKARNGNR